MAIPDPHMEELRLTTYEPRIRGCKVTHRTPRRNEFIEVLWCLDQLPGLPERWCTAEVLHVSGTHEQGKLGHGVIRYIPDDSWNEEIHSVEFLMNQKLRRRCGDESEAEESINRENPNPTMEWQFAVGREQCSEPSDDEEWAQNPLQPLPKRSKTSISPATLEERHKTEIVSLRTGYASLSVEMEKVKRQLLTHSQLLNFVHNQKPGSESCSSAGCVLQRLRYRLGLKMQMGLRTLSSATGKRVAGPAEKTDNIRTGDGLLVDTLKVRVECSLRQFECIAREAKAVIPDQQVHFVPDFLYTQLPSQSSSAFRILFSTFYDMVSFVGVSSLSDVMEMGRKCGTGPQGDILRILGTYQFNGDNSGSAASIFLATSCGSATVDEAGSTSDGSGSPVNDCNAPPETFPVLERKSRDWNKVDRRFTHPLNLTRKKLPPLNESTSRVQAFSIEWKRGGELGSRTWSKSMMGQAQVFGWMELTLPFIQVEGKYLCEELGGLANDDVWEALFAKGTTDGHEKQS